MEAKALFDQVWASWGRLQIVVDPLHPEVVLPKLQGQGRVVTLNLSKNYKVLITPDAKGIHATLSFSNRAHECFFPWDCIIVMAPMETDSWEGIQVWDDDRARILMAETIAYRVSQVLRTYHDDGPDQQPPPPRARPKLTVLPGGK